MRTATLLKLAALVLLLPVPLTILIIPLWFSYWVLRPYNKGS